jgi:CelD/BcsL family acetyltransferase involved in cellulose biosynthesis
VTVTWGGLEGDWPAAGPHPFADREWLTAWWEAFGHGTPHVARDGAGVLAMHAHGGRLLSMANYHSPLFDAPAALVTAALQRREPEVHLHAVAEPPPAGRRRLVVEEAHTSPIVETGGDLDAYVKGLGSTIKRRRRKLEREHEVTMRLDDGGEDLDAALERGFAIEASGWKTRAGTAILSAPNTQAFYTALARAYRARGELMLGTLAVDGRDVAWHFTLRRGPRLYMLKTGYLEEAGKLAPGLVLHLLTIEHCFADPAVEAYELLGDVERWKLEFATTERRHVRAWAFTRGPLGSLRWLARRHGAPAVRRIRDRRARETT